MRICNYAWRFMMIIRTNGKQLFSELGKFGVRSEGCPTKHTVQEWMQTKIKCSTCETRNYDQRGKATPILELDDV